jgi:hypothetical protein
MLFSPQGHTLHHQDHYDYYPDYKGLACALLSLKHYVLTPSQSNPCTIRPGSRSMMAMTASMPF